ncbi:hypothetical protein Har1131_17290 [Haloarcula sp. CBA1131]|uniref:hypothetical protein n=1 Tax=Haloarcula sp. CBA1131 TaxID=1853686 RepID=UPI0012464BE7|nr:hypothetical protein [Haloarcula sp. CBA1131]KAA9400779.1 hypothetical protein Har1131_19110 [Haloarcula sp. CBA1131]KAA9404123.1 hypothetical protein Har1131_17290 [Haloarcula sp. CBA1131]
MSAEYAEEDLPEETIVINGRSWQREHFDTDGYQWVRELDDSEYDWDCSEVNLVGTDVPIQVVSLQHRGSQWYVEAAETAGPDYHRPGFTELIGSEYHTTVDEAEAAFDEVRSLVKRLS